MSVTLMACYGAPAGPPGAECFADADCGSGNTCSVDGFCVFGENCFDTFDNDGDGLIDEGDSDCEVLPFESRCDDGEDDDEDGDVDCADLDCAGAEECLEICDNGEDDDADGDVDCLDDDCAPCPATELDCADGVDQDQDGLVDCADEDCAALCTPATCGDGLVAPVEECDDANTAMGDGCSEVCQLELPLFCAELTTLVVGSNDGDTTPGTNAFSAIGCVPSGGLEQVFTFTAEADGTLYLSLDAQPDMGVYVLDGCAPEAGLLACANALPGGQVESTSVPMVLGQTVAVVADGVGPGASGAFTLVATFVLP